MDNNSTRDKAQKRIKYEGRYAYRTFYFPNSDDYNIIWNEFCKLVERNSSKEFFNKNEKHKKAIFLRRFIIGYVIMNTSYKVIRDLTQGVYNDEIKKCINNYHKYQLEKKYGKLIDKSVSRSLGLGTPYRPPGFVEKKDEPPIKEEGGRVSNDNQDPIDTSNQV